MAVSAGKLYGIGVGPGDPDLVTVKAVNILRRVAVVFAASSSKNEYSLARDIVGKHLNGCAVKHMPFPMTKDRNILEAAWEQNARKVIDVLDSGCDAAFVTIGDPLTYSTYSYLLFTITNMRPDIKIETIPGITSYQAAAAAANTPLTSGEESFHLISGAFGGCNLRKIIKTSDNIVMLKTYRHFDDIYSALEELDLLDKSVCVTRCGLDGETVVSDVRSLKGAKLPYLSLIIIKKKGFGPSSL